MRWSSDCFSRDRRKESGVERFMEFGAEEEKDRKGFRRSGRMRMGFAAGIGKGFAVRIDHTRDERTDLLPKCIR